jgi:hypothetical protein
MLPLTIAAETISTTDTVEVAVAISAVTSEGVRESRLTIRSPAIPATVTRVMTVNKLLALLIKM